MPGPGERRGRVGDGAAMGRDLARTLLAEAGLADGFETSLAYNAGDPIPEFGKWDDDGKVFVDCTGTDPAREVVILQGSPAFSV